MFWRPLAYNVKFQWTNFCSPPIKLLESFVFSTEGNSVKHPLVDYSHIHTKISDVDI
jgi:hypothetical protein